MINSDNNIKGLNLLHPNIFKLFKKITHIEIDVDASGKMEYKFDLVSFLSVIKLYKDVNISCRIKGRGKTWLSSCVKPSISSYYKDQSWDITYKKTKDRRGDYDNIYIKRRGVCYKHGDVIPFKRSQLSMRLPLLHSK